MAAQIGDRVQVHYTGTVESEVFDTSVGGDPIEFQIGSGEVIPGFEEAIVGMEVGEKKTFDLVPEEAFGEYVEDLAQAVPKEFFEGHSVREGQQVQLQGRDGRVITARITEVTDETVTLDMNHPLAGKTLTFEVELVDTTSGRGSIIVP